MKVVIEHEEDPDDKTLKYDGLIKFSNSVAQLKSSFKSGHWFEPKYKQESFVRACSYDDNESCKAVPFT